MSEPTGDAPGGAVDSATNEVPDDIRSWAQELGIPDKVVRPTQEDTLREFAKSQKELDELLGRQSKELAELRKQAAAGGSKAVADTDGAAPPAHPDRMTLGDKQGDAPPSGAMQAIEKAGLDAEALRSKWAKSGRLDDSDYEAIAKVNPTLDRATVNTIAEGMSAKAELAERYRSEAKQNAIKIVSGKFGVNHEKAEAALADLLRDAPNFVPADEMPDLQERLDDPKRYRGAIRDLIDLHNEAVGAGRSKPLIVGSPSSGRSDLPKTRAEWRAQVEQANRDVAMGKKTLKDIAWVTKIDPRELPEK